MQPEVLWWSEVLYEGMFESYTMTELVNNETQCSYWPEKMPKSTVYNNYLGYVQRMGTSTTIGVSQLFKDVVYKYCPEIKESRVVHRDEKGQERRVRTLCFPSLERCRGLFARESNIPIEWPAEEVELDEK